jgi:hypothetical protein
VNGENKEWHVVLLSSDTPSQMTTLYWDLNQWLTVLERSSSKKSSMQQSLSQITDHLFLGQKMKAYFK